FGCLCVLFFCVCFCCFFGPWGFFFFGFGLGCLFGCWWCCFCLCCWGCGLGGWGDGGLWGLGGCRLGGCGWCCLCGGLVWWFLVVCGGFCVGCGGFGGGGQRSVNPGSSGVFNLVYGTGPN
ncbi:hypothetical protein RA267_27900, partial [Pseudomonas syringae pv. tagetis]|uniref:hypothetical protein n=1 Tax=Pseudomonas syringae group genomosp. 7 TaxID=251699 RepID=UPI00376F8D0F